MDNCNTARKREDNYYWATEYTIAGTWERTITVPTEKNDCCCVREDDWCYARERTTATKLLKERKFATKLDKRTLQVEERTIRNKS